MSGFALDVHADADKAAKAAASLIAEQARAAIAARGRFVIAVSGGRTPWAMLRMVARLDLPWSKLHIVQVDERAAPAGHADRNLTALWSSLESASLRPEQIHEMPVEAADFAAAAARYEAVLRALAGTPPVLDVVQLGLGTDGHTASLIPGSTALDVKDSDVAVVEPYQGWPRMTLTYPILNRARFVFFLVTGAEKAVMLARLQAGDHAIPAGRLRPKQGMIIADSAAARDIKSR